MIWVEVVLVMMEDARSINDVKVGDTDEKGRRELDGRAR